MSIDYERAYQTRKPGIKYTDYGLKILALLKDYNCKKLLDMGCGRSMITVEATKFCDVTGLDISEEALKPMRQVCPQAKYIQGDCRKLPFKNDSFDCVVACELIEHLTEQDGLKMIMEAHRVLTPGGKLILTTPIKKPPLAEIYYRIISEIFDRGRWTHVHEYSILGLFETLVKQFDIIHFEKTANRQIFVVQK